MLYVKKISLIKNAVIIGAASLSFSLLATTNSFSDGHVYGENNPITVKGYKGSKKDSTAYTGQMARQLQHNSLKKIVSKGNPNDPTSSTMNKMLSYCCDITFYNSCKFRKCKIYGQCRSFDKHIKKRLPSKYFSWFW